MIPVRSNPGDSEKELDELYEVFLLIKDKWKTDVSSTVLLNEFLRNSCTLCLKTQTSVLLSHIRLITQLFKCQSNNVAFFFDKIAPLFQHIIIKKAKITIFESL